MKLKKKLTVGKIPPEEYGYENGRLTATVEVRLREKDEGQELSITGDIEHYGKMCQGGQIRDTLEELHEKGQLDLKISEKMFNKLMKFWDRWHLNGLNAGCEHQREQKEEIKQEKGEDFFHASNLETIWELDDFEECPQCGYKYGTSWKFEELPDKVKEFVEVL